MFRESPTSGGHVAVHELLAKSDWSAAASLRAVSYDLFAQGFDAGNAAPMPSSAFDVFRPHVDRAGSEHHFWQVHTPDGGEADIYADVPPGTFLSFMISRFSAGQPLDLLAEFTVRAGAVILAPGGPAMLTAEAQRRHLPDDSQRDAIVVRNGADLRQALETF
ncbi:hypothetical protein [Amycolatopsis sp. FDAARGOS 1241]|uniref:hypothetical protein n=1 Tax=Amycolatopsis sp. FDAARGOS 1241 TaxID=2778070 RepID=UPI0019504CDD|nr:hypothetical protein [Amycolatopsis sp. FDAARGOS 1241]QRP49750.1 hypothetical protein I6J71_19615 [Amycolatopsis sp. FDAARGOS 1241]